MLNWTDIVRGRLREVSGEPPDPDLVEEMAVHLTQVYEDARAEGMTGEEAQRHVRRLLESSHPFLQALDARRPRGRRRISEWTRQEPPGAGGQRGIMARIDITRDSRYALRMLVRTPVFSLIAILTFAIGIGINTAVFSVVNGVLLEALPVVDCDCDVAVAVSSGAGLPSSRSTRNPAPASATMPKATNVRFRRRATRTECSASRRARSPVSGDDTLRYG